MRELTGLERAVHYWQALNTLASAVEARQQIGARTYLLLTCGQVSSGDPQLSVPQPKRDVSVWDARDHAVILPWQSLLQVVRAVAWVDGSLERYGEYAWAHGVAFVAHGT